MAGTTTYDVLKYLSQAASNSWDGAHSKSYSLDGKEHRAGLRREEGEPLIDKRVMDGFHIAFHGDKLQIKYQSECTLKEVYDPKFEDNIEDMISNIASFLVKEYKTYDPTGITLTPDGEMKARVENASKVRTWVTAQRYYKISRLEGVVDARADAGNTVDDKFKKFLEMGDVGEEPASKHQKGAHIKEALKSPSSPKGDVELKPEQEEAAWDAGYEGASYLASKGYSTDRDSVFLWCMKHDKRVPKVTEGDPSFWEWVHAVGEGAKAFVSSAGQ